MARECGPVGGAHLRKVQLSTFLVSFKHCRRVLGCFTALNCANIRLFFLHKRGDCRLFVCDNQCVSIPVLAFELLFLLFVDFYDSKVEPIKKAPFCRGGCADPVPLNCGPAQFNENRFEPWEEMAAGLNISRSPDQCDPGAVPAVGFRKQCLNPENGIKNVAYRKMITLNVSRLRLEETAFNLEVGLGGNFQGRDFSKVQVVLNR